MKKGSEDRPESMQRHDADASNVELQLESTTSQTMRGLRIPVGHGGGGNPYDSVPGATTATGLHRIDDMRRLSEWIRMKRDLENRNRKK